MTNYLLKSIPPQSATLYRYLSGKKPMSAKDLGKELKILPHAVYRAMGPLTELGLVTELDTYPIAYEATPMSYALDLYSFAIRQNFLEAFAPKKSAINGQLDISFIRNRQDLLEETNEDIKRAKNSVDFIVSGLEVPAETVLIYKRSTERGVKVRALVQQLDETRKEMFNNWKKIGVNVKYYPNMEARIFIIDEQIVYFTSYNPTKKDEGIGIRFAYIAYAKLMSEVFDQRWKLAREI